MASVIGYILSDFLLIYFTKTKANRLSVSFKDCHVEKKEFLDIFTIGIPASITNLMSSIGVALTNRYLVVFGNESVAANGNRPKSEYDPVIDHGWVCVWGTTTFRI